jgi:hypothetical protein
VPESKYSDTQHFQSLRIKSAHMRPMRRVQLHLVTLLALSFTAAGLLWMNVPGSPGVWYVKDYEISGDAYEPVVTRADTFGWPKPFLIPELSFKQLDPFSNANGTVTVPFTIQLPGEKLLHGSALVLDVLVALGLLLLIGGYSEWLLRSRANVGEASE